MMGQLCLFQVLQLFEILTFGLAHPVLQKQIFQKHAALNAVHFPLQQDKSWKKICVITVILKL